MTTKDLIQLPNGKNQVVHSLRNEVYGSAPFVNRFTFTGSATSKTTNKRKYWDLSKRTACDLEFIRLQVFLTNRTAHNKEDEIEITVESNVDDSSYLLILGASKDGTEWDGELVRVGNTYEYTFQQGQIVPNESTLRYKTKLEKGGGVLFVAQPAYIMGNFQSKTES